MRLFVYLSSVATCFLLAALFVMGQPAEPGIEKYEPIPFNWVARDTDTRPAWFDIRWEDGRQMSFDARTVTVLSYFPPGWGYDHGYIELHSGQVKQRIDLPPGETGEALRKAMFEITNEH